MEQGPTPQRGAASESGPTPPSPAAWTKAVSLLPPVAGAGPAGRGLAAGCGEAGLINSSNNAAFRNISLSHRDELFHTGRFSGKKVILF